MTMTLVETLADALGHKRTPNSRCLARVAETPPQLQPPGPHNPPMWCCLPQGHDGQHRHNGGGMYPSIPFRDTDAVVMGDPLPDYCEKCRYIWPCPDVQAITAALSAQPAQSVDVAGALRKGFMTAESCGPARYYVLSIKFGPLDDLQSAHNALVGLTAAIQEKGNESL